MNVSEIEAAGKNYHGYMYHDEDIVPSKVYSYQISLRKSMLEQELKNKSFDVVLDLGCGIGINSVILDQFTKKFLILSDLSKEAVKIAKLQDYKNKIITQVCGAASFSVEPSLKINLVHICGVLHHLPSELDKCIANFTKYAAKQVLVIVDEPNVLNPLWFIVMKLSHADPIGDERPLSLQKILKIFESYGYVQKNVIYYAYFTPLVCILTNNKMVINLFEKVDLVLSKTFLKIFGWRWRIILARF